MVTVVNPVYIGAVGSTFGTQLNMQAYMTSTAWTTIVNNVYQGDANPVLTAIRALTLPFYYVRFFS